MAMKYVPWERWRTTVRHALGKGAELTGKGSVYWNAAGRCERPFRVEYTGAKKRRSSMDDQINIERGIACTMDIDVPCRKCDRCLAKRRALWTHRATVETMRAERTWFGTLTLHPEQQNKALYQASQRLMDGGTPLNTCSTDRVFQERVAEIGPWIQLYVKRLRKGAKAPFKLLLVTEAHVSGLPHFHALLHESSEGAVKKADLDRQWMQHGFAKWRLVGTKTRPEPTTKLFKDEAERMTFGLPPRTDRDQFSEKRAAAYVCKYLSKSALTRVKASLGYGLE